MKAYRKRRDRKLVDQAYVKGFRKLQAELMSTFLRIGKGEMNGYTAHEIVKNSVPDVPRET